MSLDGRWSRRGLLGIGLGVGVVASAGCTVRPPEPPPPESIDRQRFDVQDFGAVGDGRADDTAAIQRAVDAALAVGGEVFFPEGTYLVVTVHLSPGIALVGESATIRRPATKGQDWLRTFTTEEAAWSSRTDSPPLVIRGLTFDGNRVEQGPYDRYQLEHAHLLYLKAANDSPGRLVADVSDCRFVDGVADGIAVSTNVLATIARCEAVNVFRGGFVLTGGGSEVTVTDFVTRGDVDRTGIDIEIDHPGHGGSFASKVIMKRVRIHDGDFDVAMRDGGYFYGEDIQVDRPPVYLAAPDAVIRIVRSTFHVGAESMDGVPGIPNRVVYPGDVEFRDCTFIADPDGASDPATISLVRQLITSRPRSGLRLSLLNCTFTTVPDLPDWVTVRAIQLDADKLATGNLLRVIGCTIDDTVDTGVWVAGGGRLEVTDTTIKSSTIVRLAGRPNANYDVTLTRLSLGSRATIRVDRTDAGCVLRINDVVVPEAANRIEADSKGSLARLKVVGGRTIVGRANPQGRQVPGLRNDKFAVGTKRWVCTRSDVSAADWRPA